MQNDISHLLEADTLLKQNRVFPLQREQFPSTTEAVLCLYLARFALFFFQIEHMEFIWDELFSDTTDIVCINKVRLSNDTSSVSNLCKISFGQ